MSPVAVKICGITNEEDARWAANLGADFIGLNFCRESPRKVSVDRAAEIIRSLPAFVKAVGVFVNAPIAEIGKTLKKANVDCLQLHGDEKAEEISKLKSEFHVPVWKVVRIENADSLLQIPPFAGIADSILLDAFSTAQPGGTGKSFDWKIAQKAGDCGVPVFLAGGLTPENVKEAVKLAQPYGVDAASGVEKTGHPRKKDVEKMKNFLANAKSK